MSTALRLLAYPHATHATLICRLSYVMPYAGAGTGGGAAGDIKEMDPGVAEGTGGVLHPVVTGAEGDVVSVAPGLADPSSNQMRSSRQPPKARHDIILDQLSSCDNATQGPGVCHDQLCPSLHCISVRYVRCWSLFRCEECNDHC